MITLIASDFYTIRHVLYDGECMTRTLSNLYNLHAVRGCLDGSGRLCDQSSMSGPHHYLGHLDPRRHHVIIFDDDETDKTTTMPRSLGVSVYEVDPVAHAAPDIYSTLEGRHIVCLKDVSWWSGSSSDHAVPDRVDVDTCQSLDITKDSLFEKPGILELNVSDIEVCVVERPWEYDMSSFRARVVPNDRPFAFRSDWIAPYAHAQHKLRLVTYNYGSRYVPDYLMKPGGSGLFIEKHDFIQLITPTSPACGGFVLLGRKPDSKRELELIGVAVPYGYTLMVHPQCIHGDSTLTGLYLMAMTGNHKAMATADTVFLKNRMTCGSVWVREGPRWFGSTDPATNPSEIDKKSSSNALADTLLLTSNECSVDDLRAKHRQLTRVIRHWLSPPTRAWWQVNVWPGIGLFPKVKRSV
jgi:hypothetical protein